MSQRDYTSEQMSVMKEVEGIFRRLVSRADLQKKSHQEVFGVGDALEQATADLALDNFPPEKVLKGRLKLAITEAEKVGLRDSLYISVMREIAYS